MLMSVRFTLTFNNDKVVTRDERTEPEVHNYPGTAVHNYPRTTQSLDSHVEPKTTGHCRTIFRKWTEFCTKDAITHRSPILSPTQRTIFGDETVTK